MGYSTSFVGSLRFTRDLIGPEIALLEKFMCEDVRDHKNWPQLNKEGQQLCHVDLEITPEYDGIQWNGAEKTYDLPDIINMIIGEMRKDVPDFGLTGSMAAQGERYDDRWTLTIGKDGFASKIEVKLTGTIVSCPHCGGKFESN